MLIKTMVVQTAEKKSLWFFAFLLGFATIAPPLNTPLGIYGDPQIVFPVLMIVFWGFSLGGEFSGSPSNRLIACLFFASVLLGILSSSLENSGNVYGLLRILKAFVMYLGALVFCNIIRLRYGKRILADRFPVWIYVLISVNGAIMVFQFVSPAFYSAMRDVTFVGSFTDILWNPSADYRMPGLSLSGGAQVSFFQSIGVILFPVIFLAERNIWRGAIFCLLFWINCFSILISGRSGFYNIAAVFPVLTLLVLIDRRRLGCGNFWNRIGIISLMISLPLVTIIYSARFPEFVEQKFSLALATAIGRSADFLSGGQEKFVVNSTTEVLWYDHVVIPSDSRTWLIGEPRAMEDRGVARILDSDIGYITYLHAFGIFGLLIQVAINLVPCWIAIRYRSRSPTIAYTAFVVSFSVIVINLKESLFFSRMTWPLQAMSFCAMIYAVENISKLDLGRVFYGGRRRLRSRYRGSEVRDS